MNRFSPKSRERIWLTATALVAVLVGIKIAEGLWLLPAMVSLIGAGLLLYWLDSSSISKFILVGLLAGYIIGNRGFAQFMPVPSIPLLPGEGALALLVALMFIEQSRGGLHRWRWRGLDFLIIAWVVLGIGRMLFDGRTYGILAVRDFAMVYYSVFYFVTRAAMARDGEAGRMLLATVRNCAVPMGILFLISQKFPGIFLDTLLVKGVPIIFYKEDLVGLFAALGSILHFLRFEETGRKRHIVIGFGLIAILLSTNNRAAAVALATMAGVVILSGRWKLAAMLGIGGFLGALILLAMANFRNESWEVTPLYSIYEAIGSIADPTGKGTYTGESTSLKGDNNLFRWVWWQLVIKETWETAPIFGLGFGYDISAEFSREYFAGMANDFTARSPHSIFVTVFARMGIVGLLLFLAIVGVLIQGTLRAIRSSERDVIGAWSGAWAILASASFGVVLEGPMGAIIFWVLLGVASEMAGRSPTEESNDSATISRDEGNDTKNIPFGSAKSVTTLDL